VSNQRLNTDRGSGKRRGVTCRLSQKVGEKKKKRNEQREEKRRRKVN